MWIEWDAALNPERKDETLRQEHVPVRVGQPSRRAIQRQVLVESVIPLTDDIVKLRLVSADGKPMPRWTAGSHIDIECGSPELSRQYSLCSDPAENQSIEVAVLHNAAGRGGSTWIHDHVRAGDRIRIRGPRNHFQLDEAAAKTIFIAGGIGITPIVAMARRAREIAMQYELHYSGNHRMAMAFIDELAVLHGKNLNVYAKNEGRRNDLKSLLAHQPVGVKVYACGPVRMLKAIEACCLDWPDDTLRIEHFNSTMGALDPAHEQAFEVELKDTGIVLTVPPDKSLLATLRAVNIDVQSDCEEGLCGACEVKVLAGKVDHRDMVLTGAERTANTKMLTCCSRAFSKRLVIDL